MGPSTLPNSTVRSVEALYGFDHQALTKNAYDAQLWVARKRTADVNSFEHTLLKNTLVKVCNIPPGLSMRVRALATWCVHSSSARSGKIYDQGVTEELRPDY